MEPLVDVKLATKRVLSKGIYPRLRITLDDFICHHVVKIVSMSQRIVDVFEFGVSFMIRCHRRECVSPHISNYIKLAHVRIYPFSLLQC